MANATAVLLFELEAPIRVNCAVGAAFEKGDCVTFTGGTNNLTVAITSANNDIMGGIVAEEKIANVGTSVAVYRRGIFKVEAGTTGCTVGNYKVLKLKMSLQKQRLLTTRTVLRGVGLWSLGLTGNLLLWSCSDNGRYSSNGRDSRN